MRDLYASRTIEKLAAHIERNRSSQTAPIAAASAISPSQAAFESVPTWERAACHVPQAVALAVYYAAIGLPAAILVFTVLHMLSGGVRPETAIHTLVIAGFLVWPAYLALSIAVKWGVVGRFRAGRSRYGASRTAASGWRACSRACRAHGSSRARR